MKNVIRNMYYWILDYAYITKTQIKGVFSKSNPSAYHRKNATPIIVIPGIYEKWTFMEPVIQALCAHGYDIHIVEKLGYNRGTVEEMAMIVHDYLTEHALQECVIVAHSKGGLIGKYLMSITPPVLLRGMVSLNTPYSGSKYAYLIPFKSVRIFIPRSPILGLLAKNIKINTSIVSVYGKFDPHIPGGSHLQGATNVQLATYGHFRIMEDPIVHDTVLRYVQRLART